MNALVNKRKDLTKLINELGLKRGVEVGVHKGEFSEHLLANSKLEVLYSIDAWMEDEKITKSAHKKCTVVNNKMEKCYQETIKRLSRFGNRSVIIRDLSENAVKEFEDESLDFIYLDASHRFTGFSIDLINWWEKLKWNGLFAGHDFWRKYRYEVAYAVNGFCMEHRQLFFLTTEERQFPQFGPSWWLMKTKVGNLAWGGKLKIHKKILKEQAQKILRVKKIITDIPYECY